MTASQPPPPGGYGQPQPGGQPGYGQQPGVPGPPPYGAPGQPPYGPPGQPPYGQQQPPPYGQPGYGRPAGSGGASFDLKRLRVADYVVGGGVILYLIFSVLPWFSDGFFSLSGFGWSGLVIFSFILILLAAAWAAVPAFTELKLGFPRGWITVGLTGLALILTLIAWIQSLSIQFSIFALLTLLVSAAVLLFAFMGLLPELQNRPALSGAFAGAAQWANQQGPQFGPGRPGAQPGPAYGQPTPAYGQPTPAYGQPTPPTGPMPGAQPQYGQPPAGGQPPFPGHTPPSAQPAPPPPPPPPPYGSSAPGGTGGGPGSERPPGTV